MSVPELLCGIRLGDMEGVVMVNDQVRTLVLPLAREGIAGIGMDAAVCHEEGRDGRVNDCGMMVRFISLDLQGTVKKMILQ